MVATVLLSRATTLVVETTASTLPEPDNTAADDRLRTGVAREISRLNGSAEEISGASIWNDPGREP